MSCEEWRRTLKCWLEDAWGPEQAVPEPPRAIEAHAAVCPGCARRLEAALLLMDGTGLRADAPPGLETRTADGIRPRRQRRGLLPARALLPARILVPVAAALITAVTALVIFRVVQPVQPTTVRVLLVLEAPQAARVSVVGDWNAWDPESNPLGDPDGDGLWTVEIQIRPGTELRYQFLIDNELWIPDPSSPFQVEDGFGGMASILQV